MSAYTDALCGLTPELAALAAEIDQQALDDASYGRNRAPYKSGATLNRHRSNTVVSTPRALVTALSNALLQSRPFATDLACTKENAKAPFMLLADQVNALSVPWHTLPQPCWLNPPYSDIAPWAEKCAIESLRGAEIVLLVPASIGSNWFADFVLPFAHVYALRPRVKFDGHTAPYPKDLIAAHYGAGSAGSFHTLDWRAFSVPIRSSASEP